MVAILQTSEHFDCLWNQIHILKVQYMSFIPQIIFSLCCHFEAKNSSSVYPLVAILENGGHI